MPYKPVDVPARNAESFADVRIVNLSISQAKSADPLIVQATMRRCTISPANPANTVDAPADTPGAIFNLAYQLGNDAVNGNADTRQLMQLLQRVITTKALEQGHLQTV